MTTTQSVIVPVQADGPIASAIAASIRKNVPGKPYADSGIGRLIWRDALAAAPAPSSLAGGAFDHIHRLAVEFNPAMHDIDQVLSEINQIALAALSPEAPARENRLREALIRMIEHFERVDAPEADKSVIQYASKAWAGVEDAPRHEATAQERAADARVFKRAFWRLAFDAVPAHDNPGDCKWRLSSTAVRILADAAVSALTPRHEAEPIHTGETPSGTAALYRDLENGIRPLTAPHHEAPADTVTISRAEYEKLKSGYPGDPSLLHEAPAEDGPVFHMNLLSHEDNEAWLESARRVAAKHEAPAEGAGELLPCPFCGGKASERMISPGINTSDDFEAISCGSCGAMISDATPAEWNLRARSSAPEARDIAYQDAHDTAVEMGYPSLTEALEDLDRLKEAREGAAAAVGDDPWPDSPIANAIHALFQQDFGLDNEEASTATGNVLKIIEAAPSADNLRNAVEALEPALDAVDEPAPKPLPEQSSRVAEAMAGKTDDTAHRQWEGRVYAAKNDLVFKVRQALAALKAEGA